MVIFHSYVSLPEGKLIYTPHYLACGANFSSLGGVWGHLVGMIVCGWEWNNVAI